MPYIRWPHLISNFGDKAMEIFGKYFVDSVDGKLTFRDEFSTEISLSLEFQGKEKATLQKLLDMMQNVCILRSKEDDRTTYYPRYDTASYILQVEFSI